MTLGGRGDSGHKDQGRRILNFSQDQINKAVVVPSGSESFPVFIKARGFVLAEQVQGDLEESMT
jgi:hypothetical protein